MLHAVEGEHVEISPDILGCGGDTRVTRVTYRCQLNTQYGSCAPFGHLHKNIH
jgi:predicted transcriptional regulator